MTGAGSAAKDILDVDRDIVFDIINPEAHRWKGQVSNLKTVFTAVVASTGVELLTAVSLSSQESTQIFFQRCN